MKNFNNRGGNRGGFGGGRKSFGRPSFGGGDRRDRGPVTMHEATCAECHQRCEVPFRPTGDKPVYCSNCFGGKREGGDRSPRRDFGRPSFSPRGFGGARDNREAGAGNDEIKRQLATINQKLDELTRTVELLTITKKADKPTETKVAKKEAVKSAKPVKAKKAKSKKK